MRIRPLEFWHDILVGQSNVFEWNQWISISYVFKIQNINASKIIDAQLHIVANDMQIKQQNTRKVI